MMQVPSRDMPQKLKAIKPLFELQKDPSQKSQQPFMTFLARPSHHQVSQ